MKPSLLLGLALALGAARVAAAGESPRQWDYPPAPRGGVVDDYFGTKIPDPYRWLEELDSPRTRAWAAEQNTLTFGFLAGIPQRPRILARLTQLWDYPRCGLPFKEGGSYFFTRNSGLQNQGIVYTQASLSAEPRVLLDPNTLSEDGTVAVTSLDVSRDGRWLAYGVASGGSDWTEFRVREVATGRDAPDVIRWVKFSEPAWTRDNRGFFYSRFPEAAADSGGPGVFGELSHQRIYYHRLGTAQADDRLVFELPGHPLWLCGTSVTEDGRYAVLTVSRGDSHDNLLSAIPLGDPGSPDVGARPIPLVDQWNAQYSLAGSDGPVLYVLTNLGAPRRRLVAIDVRSPEPGKWRTVVAEGPEVIEAAGLIGGRLVLRTMQGASSRLVTCGTDGSGARPIGLPGIGSVPGFSGHADDSELFFSYTDFTTPPAACRHDLSTGRTEPFEASRLVFDPSAYDTRQVSYPSRDGTPITMFITSRKGLKRGKQTPAVLYGYGGFDIPMTPAFSPTTLAWLEMGGIYAVPNLRGGGEYGRDWHEAGTKERKQNVFDDFIAAAQWLFDQGYTSPGRLVISGRSNGGLLIGATLNQRPDICRVAWPGVGVMDMLRFQRFTIGHAWISDYGSSDDPAGFRYLKAYSPLHTVRNGARYPAVLVTTADRDDRVYPAHSFKYTAQMQASAYNGPGALPIFLRCETRAGHSTGKPTSKLIEEEADKLAFAAHFLGLEAPP